MSKNKPAYYAVIPAAVRYDNDLSANAKLLYGEITALAGSTGECWASNGYFAGLYDVKPTTVSEWVSLLAAKGYIGVVVDRAAGNKRKIRIAIPQNLNTSSGKAEDPSSGKAEDNNTSVNNSLNSDRDAVYRLYLRYFVAELKFPDLEYAEAMEKAEKRYKLTPRRAAAVDRRLKDCGKQMLGAAIIGYAKELNYEGKLFYRGEGNRGWVADLEKFICHTYENVEKGANLYEQQKSGKQSGNDWDHLNN